MSVGMDRPVRQRWWRSRRFVLAGGVAAVLCVAGFMALAFMGPARRSVRVDQQLQQQPGQQSDQGGAGGQAQDQGAGPGALRGHVFPCACRGPGG